MRTELIALIAAGSLLAGAAVNAQSLRDQDLTACRQTDDSLERLTCYDRLVDSLGSGALTVEAAFSAFVQLNEYEGHVSDNGPFGHVVRGWTRPAEAINWLPGNWRPYLGEYWSTKSLDLSLIRQVSFLQDCVLYDERHWRIDATDEPRRAVPTQNQLVVTYEVIIPLAQVDLELTRGAGGGTIVMSREGGVFSSAYGRAGWSGFDDLLPFGSILPGGAAEMKRDQVTLEVERKRSMEVTFARAYPEDQRRAFEAFLSLAQTCQD